MPENNTQVDARGLSCPEPLVLTKAALTRNPGGIKVLVDNKTAVENISRFVRGRGYTVETEDGQNEYTLIIKK